MRRLDYYHLFYWVGFVIFFSVVWGTYDNDYVRNFFVQVWSLPARMVVVYVTLWVLIPKLYEKKRFLAFNLYLLLLLVTTSVALQRPIILTFVEGSLLPYHSAHFFNLTELMNTVIDVGLAAIFPIGYQFYLIWRESQHKIKELTDQFQALNNQQKGFMMIKEGSVMHRVRYTDILYIESQKNYVRIKTRSKEFVSYGSISSVIRELPNQFFQVHRSFIVNSDHLESFSSKTLMVDGMNIPIGRKYKLHAESMLSKFTLST